MTKTCTYGLNLFFLLILLTSAGFAQGTGKLAGKVTDAATNEPILGVSISVKDTRYGTVSQADGTYIFSIPAGKYVLVVTMSGFATLEIPGTEIRADQTSFFPIVMLPSSKELDQVIIQSSTRSTQAAVFNVKRKQAAASDVISVEAIARTPDNNAGQVSRRITGVSVQDNRFIVVRGLAEQYNQTILNNVPMPSTETDRNAFSLDLIPAVVIESIVVNKTATPDMPGNFAGGLLQVNTKEFPTDNFISFSLQGSFYSKTQGKDFYSDKRGPLEWLGFGGNTRTLPSGFPQPKDPVPLMDMNVEERIRNLRLLPNNLAPINNGSSGPNNSIQFGLGKTVRFKKGSTFGIVMALNQRRSELIEPEVTARQPVGPGAGGVGDFKFLNYYSENIRYNYEASLGGALNLAYRFGTNKIIFSNLYSNIFRNTFIDRHYASIESFDVLSIAPGTRVAGTTHISDERRIISNILSGEHRVGRNNDTRLDWNVNFSNYNTENPDTRNFVYKKVDSTGYLLGNNNAGLAQALSYQSRIWSKSADRIMGAAFNSTSTFNWLSRKHLFKTGFLFQNRSRNAEGLLIPYAAPEGILDSLLAPSAIYPNGPLDYVTSFAAIAGQVGNYIAGSSLWSVYESLENNVGKNLRIIWGLRVENYHQYVNVFKPVYFDNYAQPDLFLDLFTSRNNFNFLPSVNFVYNLRENITLRAAYSSTVIRPELKDLAPFLSYDFRTFQVTQGNQELRSTTVNNVDLKFELYPTAGEVFSVAAYYKGIKDPIEKVAGVDNDPAIRPVNTGIAYVTGIEVEWRKRLSFIKSIPWLSNVTIFGNGSLIKSLVKEGPVNNFFINNVTEHQLSGQPSYIINAGISVQAFKKSFEATFSYNRSSDFIMQLGTFNEATLSNGNKTPSSPHFWVRSRDLGDLVISQNFFRNRLKMKFNVSNIFNARFIIYQDLNGNGKFDTPVSIDKANPNYVINVGIDNTPSNVMPQRNYSISVNYTFKLR